MTRINDEDDLVRELDERRNLMSRREEELLDLWVERRERGYPAPYYVVNPTPHGRGDHPVPADVHFRQQFYGVIHG